jgi:DNA-binding response OmpR family regulator
MARKILVVDDERLIVKSTCILLRHQGYATVEAYSGAEGLEAARTERPDIILLDLVMPGMDGWQMLDRLQEDPATAGIPVIIFTAKDYANAETVGSIRGARGYVRKPFEPEDLEEVIRRLESGGAGT